MKKQTWIRKVRTVVATIVLISVTGCMSTGSGVPHPFTTMFQHYPPAQQHTQRTQQHTRPVFKTTSADYDLAPVRQVVQ